MDSNKTFSQKEASAAIDNEDMHKQMRRLTTSENIAELAQLKSITTSHASAWISAIPSSFTGGEMKPATFKHALAFWLHLPLLQQSERPREDNFKCNRCHGNLSAVFNVHGYHTLTCKHGPFLNKRHDALRTTLFELATQAGLTPSLEPRNLLRVNQERPADVYVHNLINGTDACLDVAVTSSQQQKYLHIAATSGGSAAANAYGRDKTAHYRAQCLHQGFDFFPVVCDEYAAWGDPGRKVLRILAKNIAARTGAHLSQVVYLVFQRMACTVIRANATALLRAFSLLPQDAHVLAGSAD